MTTWVLVTAARAVANDARKSPTQGSGKRLHPRLGNSLGISGTLTWWGFQKLFAKPGEVVMHHQALLVVGLQPAAAALARLVSDPSERDHVLEQGPQKLPADECRREIVVEMLKGTQLSDGCRKQGWPNDIPVILVAMALDGER